MTKKEFFVKEDNCFFFDQPKEIADYCRTYWQEDVAHILRVADEVCGRYFLFDLKWDMERTYEPIIFKDQITWDYMPSDDKEFIFQFNRHRFFICLGQAYQLTSDEKYAKAFTELLMDWITNVKKTEKMKESCWRILETGIRGENWTKAIRYFKDSPYLTDEVIDAFYHSLLEHADFIVEMHSPYRLISNWGVIENHGLFEIAMALPPSERSDTYARTAIKRLDTLIRMGVMNDGVQWEQSPMYHNEVLHCYLDVLILAGRNGIKLPQTTLDKVKQMAYADAAWKKPDHHQFIMGDSDDTDIRDIISVAAYLFRDPVLKYCGFERLDFESIWDLGLAAAIEYNEMTAEKPSYTSVALSDSGNYYIRSDWEENANLLHFHCGTLGAGHGHSDKLHIDLVIKGEDILMDGGRYNYVAGPNRYEFKDPMEHNTMTVDNKLFTICKDSWECSKLSQPVKQQFVIGDLYEFVQGGHLGYMDMENGVFHNRKIVHIKPDIYIIMDELYTGGEHEYQQYFHFNNIGEVILREESIPADCLESAEQVDCLRLAEYTDGLRLAEHADSLKSAEHTEAFQKQVSYIGEKAQADFYFLKPDISLEKIKTRISRNYNQTEENITIKTFFSEKGFSSAITVIHGGTKNQLDTISVEKLPVRSALKKTEYPSFMAEAVKLEIRDKTYVVILCHQEVNSPTDLVEADGCLGFGNVIVFDKTESTEVGTVLNY